MTTIALSKFASALRFEDLPAPVVEKAKNMVQDFIGVSLFVGRNTPWGKVMAEFAANETHDGEATIVGYERKATPSRAALANGTMAFGFEFEDVHHTAGLHPHPAIVPSALAIGEKEKVNGKEFLTAVVLGYEVMIRTSLASGKSCGRATVRRGMYPSQLYGVFGAAAAAGRLLQLDADTMAMALGLAGEQSAGTMQSHTEGAWSRRWHGGKAAENGITAALLARAGFIGPRKILEGNYNFYRAHAFDFAPEKLTEGLGQRYEIEGVSFKFYPCCGINQAPVDLVLDLKNKHNIKPDEVDKIICYLWEAVGQQKSKDFTTIVLAQYNPSFCIATAMLKGKVTPSEFTERTIRDPEIVSFAREKVDIESDADLTTRGEENQTDPARVIIRLKNGREYSGEEMFPKGDPRNPMSPEELKTKFVNLATTVLDQKRTEELYTLIRNLDQLKDICRLTELLRHG